MNQLLPLNRVGALDALHHSLNGILHNMSTHGDYNLLDDTWKFADHRRTIYILDFSYFNDSLFAEYQKNKITYNDEVLTVGLSLYIKLLFLHVSIGKINTSSYIYRFDVLKMFFTFLVQSKLRVIDELRLKDFYSILITCDLSKGEFVKRYRAPSCKSRLLLFSEIDLNKLAARFKSEVFIEKKLLGKISSLRNSVCKIVLGISYQDYIDGGSYDSLGLEIGKYYVDHCGVIFDENSLYATAVRKTCENFKVICASENEKYRTNGMFFIANTLMGINEREMNNRECKTEYIYSWIEYAYFSELETV